MRWLPNILTLLRLPLAACVALLIVRGDSFQALLLLTIAGLTDGLDGYLARRFDAVSRFGALLDPVADKALLVSAFVALGVVDLLPMWLVWIVVARDVLILAVAGAALLAGRRSELAPSAWGKLSTFVQILTGLVALGRDAIPASAIQSLAVVLPTVTAITTAWSGLHYAWRGIRLLPSAAAADVPPGPLRVLLVAPSPRYVGGQSVQAAGLFACLRQAPELEIGLQYVDPDFVRGFQWLRRVKYVRTVANLAVYTLQLTWRIPRYRIVHVFTPGLTAYLLTALPVILLGLVFRKKVIVNYHDGRVEDHLKVSKLAPPTLRMASAVVSPSEFVVQAFQSHGIPARCIHNVIDPAPFHYRERGRLRPVFLTNRMLDPLYNVECVLRAFAIIQREYPEASLTVAHDGPCRTRLESVSRELSLRNVVFTGHVAVSKMPDLYDSVDIYLMSPSRDCMPLTLLECFASGLPAVSTRVGGVPYMLSHERTGLLVAPADHAALAADALRLLSDPELVRSIATAARGELAKYSCPAVRAQWLNLYRRLAGEG